MQEQLLSCCAPRTVCIMCNVTMTVLNSVWTCTTEGERCKRRCTITKARDLIRSEDDLKSQGPRSQGH
jgi:hypothetical protein